MNLWSNVCRSGSGIDLAMTKRTGLGRPREAAAEEEEDIGKRRLPTCQPRRHGINHPHSNAAVAVEMTMAVAAPANGPKHKQPSNRTLLTRLKFPPVSPFCHHQVSLYTLKCCVEDEVLGKKRENPDHPALEAG